MFKNIISYQLINQAYNTAVLQFTFLLLLHKTWDQVEAFTPNIVHTKSKIYMCVCFCVRHCSFQPYFHTVFFPFFALLIHTDWQSHQEYCRHFHWEHQEHTNSSAPFVSLFSLWSTSQEHHHASCLTCFSANILWRETRNTSENTVTSSA